MLQFTFLFFHSVIGTVDLNILEMHPNSCMTNEGSIISL